MVDLNMRKYKQFLVPNDVLVPNPMCKDDAEPVEGQEVKSKC